MKNLLWLLALAIAMVSCDDKNDDSTSKAAQVAEAKEIAKNGTWIITYFLESDQDKTANFTDYNFTFSPSGTVTAVNGPNTYTGTWSITADDSNDDDDDMDEFDDIDFNISFSTPAAFSELTEDWEIILMSSAKIQLRHTSDDGGSTDLLTFEQE